MVSKGNRNNFTKVNGRFEQTKELWFIRFKNFLSFCKNFSQSHLMIWYHRCTNSFPVKDVKGEVVKTISIDNEKREALVQYPDGSWEEYFPVRTTNLKGEKNEAIAIRHFSPYDDEPDKDVVLFKDGHKRVTTYFPYEETREYDKDGNLIKVVN